MPLLRIGLVLSCPRESSRIAPSREQAIVAAVTAERGSRVAAAVAARPAGVRLADAVVEAIVEQYTTGENARDLLLLVTARPALRQAFVDTATAIEHPLAAAIAERIGDADRQTPRVLAASVAAAIRVALERWVQPTAGSLATGGLIVPWGSLADLLRAALAPLAPALDATEGRPQPPPHH